MIKFLFLLSLIFSSNIFSAPSNAGKTINTWVYYEFLRIEEKEAQKRFAEVEELASLVTWLSSEENSFSTAAVFDLSGGRATY